MTPNEPSLIPTGVAGSDEWQKPAAPDKMLNRRTTTVLQWPLVDPHDGLPDLEPVSEIAGSGGQRLSYNDDIAWLR